MFMSKLQGWVTASALSAGLLAATGATAATIYSVDVLYGATPTVVAGSDVPGSFSLAAGDSLHYTLSAEAGKAWRVTATDSLFAVFALGVQEAAQRVGDFSLMLSQGGAVVKTLAETDVSNWYVHAGVNTLDLAVGTQFDSFSLTYTLTSAAEVVDDGTGVGNYVLTGNVAGTTLSGPLPIFGAPQVATSSISYISAVPEPSEYAMLLLGLGVIGAVARRRR